MFRYEYYNYNLIKENRHENRPSKTIRVSIRFCTNTECKMSLQIKSLCCDLWHTECCDPLAHINPLNRVFILISHLPALS